MKMRCTNSVVRAWGTFIFVAAMLSFIAGANLKAQGNGAAVAATAKAAAPRDLTGYWVSIVTEDWRWRMTIPDKSDYVTIPINEEGRRAADAWDPAKDKAAADEQCKGYGAAVIMQVPGRFHITWQDDNTLKIDIDSGTQTRLLHFGGSAPPNMAPTWQGYSVAYWGDPSDPVDQRGGGGGPAGQRSPEHLEPANAPRTRGPLETYLRVVTTHMRPGYLHKNGVPYSGNAMLQEFYTVSSYKNYTWLAVTTVVTDPQYLVEPYVTHAHYKKLADNSGWDPTPCKSDEVR